MTRVIKRPRHGWGRRTLMDRLSSGFWWCVLLCWLSAITVSVWANTWLLLSDLMRMME